MITHASSPHGVGTGCSRWRRCSARSSSITIFQFSFCDFNDTPQCAVAAFPVSCLLLVEMLTIFGHRDRCIGPSHQVHCDVSWPFVVIANIAIAHLAYTWCLAKISVLFETHHAPWALPGHDSHQTIPTMTSTPAYRMQAAMRLWRRVIDLQFPYLGLRLPQAGQATLECHLLYKGLAKHRHSARLSNLARLS